MQPPCRLDHHTDKSMYNNNLPIEREDHTLPWALNSAPKQCNTVRWRIKMECLPSSPLPSLPPSCVAVRCRRGVPPRSTRIVESHPLYRPGRRRYFS